MNVIKLINALFGSIFLFSASVVEAADEKHMTIGLWASPPAAGDPYTGTTVPPILTLPAMFDGLTRITRSGDLGRREALVRTLLRRYHDDPPAIHMSQMVGFTGLSPRVKNFVSDYGVYNFHAMDLATD